MLLRPAGARPALSLFEVIIATAVMLMSMVGLGHLVTTSGNVASLANKRSQAGLLAQSKLAELEAGAVPLNSTGGQSFDENPDYRWSVDVQSGPAAGLNNVTITVSSTHEGGPKWSISRMMLDPTVVGSTQDVIPVTQSAASANGTPVSTGSSGSTSSSGGTSGSGTDDKPMGGMTGPAGMFGKGGPKGPGGMNPGSKGPGGMNPAPKGSGGPNPAPKGPGGTNPAPKGGTPPAPPAPPAPKGK